MVWHQLAARLGMSLQRCQDETTSSEFLGWQEFFRIETNEKKTEHYYLAQIACEVRRAFSKHPEKIKIEHFLLNFNNGSDATAKKPARKATAEDIANSKAAWFAFTGLKNGKTQTRQPPST